MLLYYVVVVLVVGVRTYVAEACCADQSGLNTAKCAVSPHTAAATAHPEGCRLSMRYFKIQVAFRNVFKGRLKFA